MNTTRIAEGCLKRVHVLRGGPKALSDQLSRLDLLTDAALLFPSPEAIDIGDLPQERRPRCLVVLDGTWHHARTLMRDIPHLASLPQVRFTPETPSEYRIRREPQHDYLSTVESIAHALRQLEPETPGIDLLRESFRTMIDRAIGAQASGASRGRFKRPRLTGVRTPAPVLTAPLEGLVVVYGESAGSRSGSQPLIFVARRQGPKAGTPLRLVLGTDSSPHPKLLEHLAIRPVEMHRALSWKEAGTLWSEFLRPNDWIVSWTRGTLRLLETAGLYVPQGAYLKELYCNRQARRGLSPRGSLEELLREQAIWPTESLAPCSKEDDPATAGRAFERLRQSEAMLHWMRNETHREHTPF